MISVSKGKWRIWDSPGRADAVLSCFLPYISGPHYLHGWTLTLLWISNNIHYKVWSTLTYRFTNFNGCFISHLVDMWFLFYNGIEIKPGLEKGTQVCVPSQSCEAWWRNVSSAVSSLPQTLLLEYKNPITIWITIQTYTHWKCMRQKCIEKHWMIL